MAEKVLKKEKAHQRYYVENADGKKVRVPGCTTITGVLAKPALINWANRMGLQGIDTSSYVDSKARMGTCAHDMVEAFLLNEKPDLSEFSQVEIDAAENSMLSFLEWEAKHEYEVIGVEMQFSSQGFRYGGTCDIYWILDGVHTLTDLKTGKGIYPEMKDQVAGYKQLLIENGYPVEQVSILNIPRAEDERFLYEEIDNFTLSKHFERFKLCRAVYELNKELNRW